MNISPVSFFFFLSAPCYSYYARPSSTFLSSYLLAIHITPVLPLLSFPLIFLLFTLRPSFLYFPFLLSSCYSHYSRPSSTFLSSYLLAIHITPVLPLLSFPLILTFFSPKSNSTELLRCPSIQCTLTNTYVHTSNKHTYITQTHVHNSHTHTTHRSRGFG